MNSDKDHSVKKSDDEVKKAKMHDKKAKAEREEKIQRLQNAVDLLEEKRNSLDSIIDLKNQEVKAINETITRLEKKILTTELEIAKLKAFGFTHLEAEDKKNISDSLDALKKAEKKGVELKKLKNDLHHNKDRLEFLKNDLKDKSSKSLDLTREIKLLEADKRSSIDDCSDEKKLYLKIIKRDDKKSGPKDSEKTKNLNESIKITLNKLIKFYKEKSKFIGKKIPTKENTSSKKRLVKFLVFWTKKKKLFFYPLLAFLSIAFEKSFLYIISLIKFEKFITFNQVNYTQLVFFIVVALIIIAIRFIRIKINKKTDFYMQLSFWLSFSLSLLYYEFCISKTTVIFFPSDSNLKYLHLIHLISFMHLVFFLCWKIKNWPGKNPLKQDSETSLFVAEDDLAIIFPDEETSPRKDLAKKIATHIIHINTEQAFALAITGEWGSGKTTFIKHIKDELEENDRAIIIPFSPWKNKGEEAVIADFFYSLKKSLSPYNEQLAPEISNYLNSLLNISTAIPAAGVSKVGKLGLQALKLLSPNIEGTEESYQKLAKAIESIEEPIVVIIDDLDRLDAGEVVAVLKLIRNVANFKGITFIVAYSKAYVKKAIEKALSDHNSQYFLEKIVQKEVILPKLDHNDLFQVLKNLLANSKEESLREIIKAKENKDWLNANDEILWFYLQTPRDIVRFYNSIILDFIEMGEYIDSRDFFYLYLIRVKYYEVYEMLWTKRDDIFTKSIYATGNFFLKKGDDAESFEIEQMLSSKGISTLPTLTFLFNDHTPNSTDSDNVLKELLSPIKNTRVHNRKNLYIKDNFYLVYKSFIQNPHRISETFFQYICGTSDHFIENLSSFSEEEKVILSKKLSTNLKSDVIHSIQSKESLSRCLHIYFTIEVNPDLIHATLYNNELQKRVIDSTDETDFASVLRQILDREEFKNNINLVLLLGALDLNDDKFKLLDQCLFKYGYMQFEGFVKKIEQEDQLDARNAEILFFCLGELFKIQSIDKKLIMSNATKERSKQVLIKFFDPLWIGNFLRPHINPFVLNGTFFYYLTLLLFPDDIEDFTKFITACSSKLNNNQHKALEEFLEAYKSQVHRTEIKQDPPVMHPNWGRYFVADLQYAPVIYGEAENIADFIVKVSNNESSIQKLYIKHTQKLFQIVPTVKIDIDQSKMPTGTNWYIAIPKETEYKIYPSNIYSSKDTYSTSKIDIDDIKLVKGNNLDFKYEIHEYTSAKFYELDIS